MRNRPHIIVIGAGIGGLTAAAMLVKEGYQVTVLEAHIYPGGSAGTFFHKGFRFDAGATLAGGFLEDGPHERMAKLLGISFPVQPADPAWITHLPGRSVTQWRSTKAWKEERKAHFPGSESFWKKQEKLAEIAWQISQRHFLFPPQNAGDWFYLASTLRPKMAAAAPYLFRSVRGIAPEIVQGDLAHFLDAQLLISAQTTSRYANALYGSAALDLPRRGVVHVCGGIGEIASRLADWIERHGGEVIYRQKVEKLITRNNRAVAVETNKGLNLSGDRFIANLTPWGLAKILEPQTSLTLRKDLTRHKPTWGAYVLYLGVESADLPTLGSLHHQVIVDPLKKLGEGNSVFISMSLPDDRRRAPAGMQTVTISTHTTIPYWWQLADQDPEAYIREKERYQERVLKAAEIAVPGISKAARLILPGTPITYQFYTRRPGGMVGGFPQTSLMQARGPATGLENTWLVGDSVFPGQSTAAVTLGAMRVTRTVIQSLKQTA